MASKREEMFNGKSLDSVADVMAGCDPNSASDQMARAEFLLRQTRFQEDAAEATKETANYTKKYTKYMFQIIDRHLLYIKRDKLVHFDFGKIETLMSRDFLTQHHIFG